MIEKFFVTISDKIFYTFIAENRYKMFIHGLLVSLQLTAMATVIGIFLGLFVAIFRIKRIPILSNIADAYVSVIRGTPVNVQLIITYFIIFKTASTDMAIYIASLAFGFNSGAYVSEIIRSGIQSVDKGQMEAARSLGLSYGKAMRLVIIPQAVKNILPALGNEFIILIKETSIAGYVGLRDLAKAGQNVGSATYDYFTPLLAVAYIYFIVTLLFSKLLTKFERRLKESD